jgi:hypothetical protein
VAGNTHYVLDLRLCNTEVPGDIRQRVARHETIDEILDPSVNDQASESDGRRENGSDGG